MTTEEQRDQPVILTIAGFDPSGGAGIIADVKTFVGFDCTPTAAITSLTFQNSEGVFGVIHESAESLRAQILPIVQDFRIAAIKTGMLPKREIVLEVARLIREMNLPAPVIDPVWRSTSGYELIETDVIDVLMTELMPLARVITPNIPEAEKLTNLRIQDEAGMRAAASNLRELGARAVLIKGGHLRRRAEVSGQWSVRGGSPTRGPQTGSPAGVGAVTEGPDQAIDVLDDEGNVTVFRGEWIDTPPVRGTGCMLSSAIAACLGKGVKLKDSVELAKQYVADTIRYSQEMGPESVIL